MTPQASHIDTGTNSFHSKFVVVFPLHYNEFRNQRMLFPAMLIR